MSGSSGDEGSVIGRVLSTGIGGCVAGISNLPAFGKLQGDCRSPAFPGFFRSSGIILVGILQKISGSGWGISRACAPMATHGKTVSLICIPPGKFGPGKARCQMLKGICRPGKENGAAFKKEADGIWQPEREDGGKG